MYGSYKNVCELLKQIRLGFKVNQKPFSTSSTLQDARFDTGPSVDAGDGPGPGAYPKAGPKIGQNVKGGSTFGASGERFADKRRGSKRRGSLSAGGMGGMGGGEDYEDTLYDDKPGPGTYAQANTDGFFGWAPLPTGGKHNIEGQHNQM